MRLSNLVFTLSRPRHWRIERNMTALTDTGKGPLFQYGLCVAQSGSFLGHEQQTSKDSCHESATIEVLGYMYKVNAQDFEY